MAELKDSDRAFLRTFLRDRFTLDELKDLAFDLGLDYEDFPHDTKPNFVRGFLKNLDNRTQIRPLVELLIQQRPDEDLAQLLARLPTENDFHKVQVILSNDKIKNKPDFKEKLAALLEIPVTEVNLIATALGSVKLLVALPVEAVQRLSRLNLPYQLEGYEIIEVQPFLSLPTPTQQNWRRIYKANSAVKWIGIGSAAAKTGLAFGTILFWFFGILVAGLLVAGGGAFFWYQNLPRMTVTNRCDATLPISKYVPGYQLLGLPPNFDSGESVTVPLLSGAGRYELDQTGRPPVVVLKLPREIPIWGSSDIPLGPLDEDEEFWLNGERVQIPTRFNIRSNQSLNLSLCGR